MGKPRLLQFAAIILFTITSYARAQDHSEWAMTEISKFNDVLMPEDRNDKYEKMSENAFAFFRGTNHLFWADLAKDPRLKTFGNARTITWIQGDAHIRNLAAFDNSAGAIVYDMNDFDESVIADFQMDVWRLAASLVFAARENGGYTPANDEELVKTFAASYADSVASYSGNNNELNTLFTKENTHGRLKKLLEDAELEHSRVKLLTEWTTVVGGKRVLNTTLPALEPVDDAVLAANADALAKYRETLAGALKNNVNYFTIKSAARRKDAGIGSLGRARFYILIEGPSASLDDDRILDVKQQPTPSPYPYMSAEARTRYDSRFKENHALRVVHASTSISLKPDEHLGWTALSDGYYSVRDLSPYKTYIAFKRIKNLDQFIVLAREWGAVLATAHARGARDKSSGLEPNVFKNEIVKTVVPRKADFAELVWTIASQYADQTKKDFEYFLTHKQ